MCINKKVGGGLAAVALATFALDPHLLSRVLPLLFVAACPLSMVLMMRAMSGGRRSSGPSGDEPQPPAPARESQVGSIPTSDSELSQLRAEIDQLRAELADRDRPARH